MARRGEYSEALVPVLSDVCCIADRLREIDDGYFIMYNRVSEKYEIHHSEQLDGTLSCELPFSQLDCRALEYVRETSISRTDKIFSEIGRQDGI